jgi:hypothetical protein
MQMTSYSVSTINASFLVVNMCCNFRTFFDSHTDVPSLVLTAHIVIVKSCDFCEQFIVRNYISSHRLHGVFSDDIIFGWRFSFFVPYSDMK